ncbi:MAG: hypothetical protein A2538_02360 [Candidatus Magasanikbacteria bacterium RIFOXYD2_FULL_41_14]|uniref:TrbC/VIRB2 family protein n=1 Tax=Candidatus Magasanikbacteria bacterium RIFOXYD2_FULL_41_14 TaxID=1798709 RepID=A0A1F6PC09_9BACT|nr:MAG: hypothetical protein A2538_02360 [Candidatus Magasanikbacteria bacterium RIFOXYD2_FULL_41_14]
MNKLFSGLILSVMMLGLVAVLAPTTPAHAIIADETPITTDDLGVVYGSYTGLGSRDVRDTVASIIRVALGLLGIVAVVIIIIGGFTWMTAGGNDEKVGEAKKWIFSGVIGLAIILSAYALANYVIAQLVTATSNT